MAAKKTIKTWSTPVVREETNLVPCALCGGIRFKKALECDGFGYVTCAGCGLVQMNPQPQSAQVMRRYEQTHGTDYFAYERANEENFLRLQTLALKDAGFKRLERQLFRQSRRAGRTAAPAVLDIGCATGTLLCELKRRGWTACGVEISPSAEYARNVRSLDVRSLPLEQNNFAPESFDVVLASHLIEHLNDPALFAREVFRVLKRNGRLYITTPNIAGFQARVFGGAWRSAIFDHLYLFSIKTLKALLSRAGFRIERVRTWGGLAAGAVPGKAARWLKKFADNAVKCLGQGDVMIIRARKPE